MSKRRLKAWAATGRIYPRIYTGLSQSAQLNQVRAWTRREGSNPSCVVKKNYLYLFMDLIINNSTVSADLHKIIQYRYISCRFFYLNMYDSGCMKSASQLRDTICVPCRYVWHECERVPYALWQIHSKRQLFSMVATNFWVVIM